MYKSRGRNEVGEGRAGQPRVCSVEAGFQEEGAACVCELARKERPHKCGLGRGQPSNFKTREQT